MTMTIRLLLKIMFILLVIETIGNVVVTSNLMVITLRLVFMLFVFGIQIALANEMYKMYKMGKSTK